MEDLTPEKIKALTMLSAGYTLQQTADKTGVTIKTISRWKLDPEFQKLLKEASMRMFDSAISELCLGSIEAAKQLRGIINDEDVPARVKISAIQCLLGTASRVRDWHNEERLERLEAAIDANNNI
ncbi:helix-turn-helix domain-containing protein [Nostoc sp. FACHB-190]|uniref:helix-turn-helix domain-containing protein n=1 Tax=Nostoc sp. FACHB-190 TaxID=2692838 RepID=UPI0016837C87|nr:helix-turn-helix domain-containing protein [Nostoc sp. FACHB-190]MBD2303617.1 helix-turn-helix domain-containing protein [Nostoc sp. FACHB-190]